MKQIFSLGAFIATFIIVVLLSFWLGGFRHPLSMAEFGVLGVIVYVLLLGIIRLLGKIFKKKESM